MSKSMRELKLDGVYARFEEGKLKCFSKSSKEAAEELRGWLSTAAVEGSIPVTPTLFAWHLHFQPSELTVGKVYLPMRVSVGDKVVSLKQLAEAGKLFFLGVQTAAAIAEAKAERKRKRSEAAKRAAATRAKNRALRELES
jgi:hypothetical protein